MLYQKKYANLTVYPFFFFFQEMATFKIAALQKVVDNSVSLSELELANKQYNELTTKYRDILQKDNMLVQRTSNLEHLEVSVYDL